jgi:hypothetical protein
MAWAGVLAVKDLVDGVFLSGVMGRRLSSLSHDTKRSIFFSK